MHGFIIDLCKSSSPENGLRFSETYLPYINSIKKFNFDNIYFHKRLECFRKYAKLIIDSIFETLSTYYDGKDTLKRVINCEKFYPILSRTFSEWLIKYSNLDLRKRNSLNFNNEIIYNIQNEKDYYLAIIDYISGMTDSFAIKVFNELTSF
ncbi:MAG: hypothetical protein HPY74_15670 [Firmicutes bacterium]|nr:hypothetical protein [Bacillota bacterium]